MRKDRVWQTVSTGGLNSRILGAALDTFQALDINDDGRRLSGVFVDGSAWESGEYIYTHSSRTLTRSRFYASSTTSTINISSGATFAESWTARDAEKADPPKNYYNPKDFFSSQGQLDGTIDSTVEFQAMIDQMETDGRAQGGGQFVCDLSDTIVLLSGSLQETDLRNCQIRLPWVHDGYEAAPDPHMQFSFISRRPKIVNFTPYVGTGQQWPGRGACPGGRIISTINGSGISPSVFCVKPGRGSISTTGFTRAGIFWENIDIYTNGYTNSAGTTVTCGMTAIDVERAWQMIGRGLYVIGGPTKGWYMTSVPATSYGIRWPTLDSGSQVYSERCHAFSFSHGHRVGEHQVGDLSAAFCRYGLEFPAPLGHSATLTRADLHYCSYPIKITQTIAGGRVGFRIVQLNGEFESGGTPGLPAFTHQKMLDDPLSLAHGNAYIHMSQGGTGNNLPNGTTDKNGGVNFALFDTRA
jgi:hypothetical protein